jgi:hypothetical protein
MLDSGPFTVKPAERMRIRCRSQARGLWRMFCAQTAQRTESYDFRIQRQNRDATECESNCAEQIDGLRGDAPVETIQTLLVHPEVATKIIKIANEVIKLGVKLLDLCLHCFPNGTSFFKSIVDFFFQ